MISESNRNRLKRTRTRRCANARVCGREARHLTLNQAHVGSNPSRPTQERIKQLIQEAAPGVEELHKSLKKVFGDTRYEG